MSTIMKVSYKVSYIRRDNIFMMLMPIKKYSEFLLRMILSKNYLLTKHTKYKK